MPPITREQYEAALAALGLDPATTVSVNLAPDWIRVVHADQAVTSMPLPAVAAEPAPEEGGTP